jgi:hypothetical protein
MGFRESTMGEPEAFVEKKSFVPNIKNQAGIILTYLQLRFLFQATNFS